MPPKFSINIDLTSSVNAPLYNYVNFILSEYRIIGKYVGNVSSYLLVGNGYWWLLGR